MPPFWKSLLGSSSSSSNSGSSNTVPSTSQPSSSSSTPSSSGLKSSKASRRASASVETTDSPASSITSTSSAKHGRPASGTSSLLSSSKGSTSSKKTSSIPSSDGNPNPSRSTRSGGGASPSAAKQQTTQPTATGNNAGTADPSAGPIGIPIRQTLSNTTSSVGGSSMGEVDTENETIPPTPYSTGHSPSHARHKFNTPRAENNSPEDLVDGEDSTNDAATSITNNASSPEMLGRSATSTGSTAGSFSNSAASRDSVISNVPQANSSSSLSNIPASSSRRPDIPTTQTILANPLPQPSSGLAAAISSVLPSSNSAPSNANGRHSGADTGPRTFDIDDMIAKLLEAGYSSKLTKQVCLKNSEITAICSAAREVFLSQPTLIELSPPVKIVGDVHGQYSDLIRLFEMCGFPPKSNYLFLGDYVDRGKQSLETILLLLCYKVKYPENFFLLRGNHECANVTRVYGFYDECKRRCNIKIWKTFIDVFNCLPITSLVAGKIFCVHGGLSPSLSSMDDIRRISRPTDVPDYGLLNDLLWSDPSDTALDWEDNERGVSYCFGKAVIQDFLAKYDFDLICRAHMVVEDGYEFWNERTLVTIFSAPNYCGEFDNFGAVMSVSEDLLCAFELLKPLDGPALKKELMKSKKKNSALLAASGSG